MASRMVFPQVLDIAGSLGRKAVSFSDKRTPCVDYQPPSWYVPGLRESQTGPASTN